MWDTKCTNCHNPHSQRQNVKWKTASYLASGAISTVTTTTLTKTGANWNTTDNGGLGEWAGKILIPNVSYQGRNHRIVSNTSDTITISTIGGDAINTVYAKTGNTFAIVYGKLVKEVVNGKYVKFFRQTGANSFADGDGTIDGVCEVCHTQTKNPNSSVPRFRSTGNSDNHYTGQSCKGCHVHSIGFKASCAGCHGNPPVDTSKLVSIPGPTGSTTAGAHDYHVNTKGIDCTVCHFNSVGSGPTHNNLPDPPQTVTVGFSLFNGAYLGGAYNGQAGVSYDTSQANTTVTNGGLKECANIYCHGSTMSPNGGTDITPVWDNASTGACGTCHGATAANPPIKGSHQKHAGDTSAMQFSVECIACHKDYTHINNLIEWKFNTADIRVQDAKYNGVSSGSAAMGTFPKTYASCTTLYCHSNAVPSNEANEYKTVTWGDTVTMGCDSCHKGRTADTITMSSGGHDRLVGKSWVRKYPCTYCHNATVDADGNISDKSKHANGTKDVAMLSQWAILGRPSPSYDPNTKICTNVYCHSDGTTDPETVRPFGWTEGRTECNTCHGHPKGTCNSNGCHDGRTDGNGKYWEVKTGWTVGDEWKAAMPMFTNQGPGTARANSHPRHLQTDFQCDVCHNATIKNGTCTDCHINGIPSGTMGEVAHIDAAYHVNKVKDVAFKNGGTYNPDKTCSNTACHTGGVDPQWGGSVNNTVICLTCHGTTGGDVDDFGAFNGVRGKINTTEWETSGHGRKTASGNYPSGNPPANFPGNPCWYCHDNNVLHKDSNNPFRLRQHPQFATRFEKECVYCHMERIDSECLGCHNSAESLAPQLLTIVAPAHAVDHSGFIDGQTSCLTSGCHLPQDAGQCRSCHASTGNPAPQLISGRVYVSIPVSPYTKDHADYAGDATNCLSASCHTDDAHIHNTGAGLWTSSLKADVKNQYMMMGVCLQCHEDDSNGTCTKCHVGPQYAIGFDPGTGFIKPEKARANSVHYGYKHFQQGTTKGGKFCWDCHDPHGDSNISMIQKKVATSTDGLYGKPATRAEVVFTKKVSGMDYAKTSAPYNGICNVCHSDDPQTTQHYGASHGDGHNSGRVCTSCHEHRFNSSHASGQDCNSCHQDKPVPSHTAFGLPRDCTKCHSGLLGKRMDILGQFKASSHHVQGIDISNKNCYVCHWEATAEGLINIQYHEGYNYKTHASTKDAKVDLVILGPNTRPAAYETSNPGAIATTFLASNMGTTNERTEVAKVTTHCLSCHSDQNNDTKPFSYCSNPLYTTEATCTAAGSTWTSDCKTPRQYAWDRNSISARYSQTGTTTWGKYSGVTNASKKNITKAYSAHGNVQNNFGGGWNTTDGEDGNLTTTRGGASAKSIQCFDCHNSHGSKTSGTTSSYVTFNGTKNGGNLKETQAGKGGYGVTYRAVAKTDGVNPYNVGAGQCFDCHESATVGTTTNASPEYKTPWGYQGTFNASAPVMGYQDTTRFGTGTKAKQTRYALKANRPVMGGHLQASSSITNTAKGTIDRLCTPCHDPHGVSPSLGSDQAYALPLLKGTWMTSPYKEDAPPPNPKDIAGGCYGDKTDLSWGTGSYGNHYDCSGAEKYPKPVSNHNIDRSTFGGSTRISESDTKFAGLCLTCHPKSNLTDGTNKNTEWKSIDRIHETVKGWGANTEHSFTCSKCHQPHNSGLPRLMTTNCLDYKHRGFRTSGGQAWGATKQYSQARTRNVNYGYPPAEMRGYPVANIYDNSASYPYETSCHFNATPVKSGDPTTWPNKNYWNNVTPW